MWHLLAGWWHMEHLPLDLHFVRGIQRPLIDSAYKVSDAKISFIPWRHHWYRLPTPDGVQYIRMNAQNCHTHGCVIWSYNGFSTFSCEVTLKYIGKFHPHLTATKCNESQSACKILRIYISSRQLTTGSLGSKSSSLCSILYIYD